LTQPSALKNFQHDFFSKAKQKEGITIGIKFNKLPLERWGVLDLGPRVMAHQLMVIHIGCGDVDFKIVS